MEAKLITMCVIILVVAGSGNAATVYTSRSDWEAAVGAYLEEDFDDGVLDPGISVVSTCPGSIQAGSGVLGPDNVWWDRLVAPRATTTTWTFATELGGFGAYWDSANPGGPGTSIRLYRNGTFVGQIDRNTAGGFWGFTNGPFDTILLTSGSTSGWCETYEMDNMVYATCSPVQVGDATVTIAQRGLAPYDQITLHVPVKIASSATSEVALTFRPGPGALVSGSWGGRSYSDEPVFVVHSADEHQVVNAGFNGEVSVRIDIEGTASDAIMDHVVEYGASGVLLDDGLTVDAEPAGGGGSTKTFETDILDEATSDIVRLAYPSFHSMAGDPPANRSFYTCGDTGYHHQDNSLVRKYALEAARYGGGQIPKSPSAVASSIASYVTDALNPKNYPDALVEDLRLTQWIEDGHLGPGKQYLPSPPYGGKGHICIEHAYLLSSLTRTIGLPTRELDVALGTVKWQLGRLVLDADFTSGQEGATQVWYDGQWNLYDLFVGVRNLDDYLSRWPIIRAWYAFDQRTQHNFAILTATGEPSDGSQWSHLTDKHKPGLIIIAYSPVTLDIVDSSGRVVPDTYRNITDPLFTGDPATQIPGASHRLAGAVGYADSTDPTTGMTLPEMIFVPADSASDDFMLTVTGVADGEYTLVMATITGFQAEGTVRTTFSILEGETHEYGIRASAGEITMLKLPVVVNIEPDVLNQKTSEQWVTAYLELPENSLGLTVSDIDLGSVTANGVSAQTNPKYDFVTDPQILDRDGDGWFELMVKFGRRELLNTLGVGDNQEVRVEGSVGPIVFAGSDGVRVLK